MISWIKNQAEARGLKALLVDVSSNSIASYYTLDTCKRTLLKTFAIGFPDEETDHNCERIGIEPICMPSDCNVAELNKYIYNAAIQEKALIVGSRCKNDILFIRNYDKFEPVDILPLAQFTLADIQNSFNSVGFILDDACYGDSLSNNDVIWLEELDKNTGIITSDADPAKHPKWFSFTLKQKQLIAKVYQTEKLTRHKYNPNIPIYQK